MVRRKSATARVYWREDRGAWFADLHRGGRRTRLALPGVTSKRAAEAAARALLDQETGAAEVPLTVGDLLEWHAGRTGIAPETRRMERQKESAIVAGLGEATRACRIDRAMLDQYARERSRVVAASTVNKELGLLGRALRRAVAEGLLQDVPRQVPRLPEERRAVRALSAEDVVALLEGAARHDHLHPPHSRQTPRIRDVVAFLVATGLRRGELMRLRWGQIDLAAARMTIRTAKRGRSASYVERVVPLSELALEALASRRAQGAEGEEVWGREGFGDGRDPYLLNLPRKLASACRLAGLPRIGLHALRHTAASLMLRADPGHLAAISRGLGHKDTTTTLNTYWSAFDTDQRAAFGGLSALISGTSVAPQEPTASTGPLPKAAKRATRRPAS